ncbi:membrane protein [Intrasporangium oryzae NRRL B-24470]|uniref:Membrane protein n=1 Tax=Intrasporangium oryzae NRRL B-24470 TaxID=1386089 RepID=W9GA90_9MICO|nr:VTT domain-containing protein [Intrasporangium oryzae]EWT02142.1 membrane protein [Intrasporangium oryzae NRRL B-24470]
MLDTLAERPFWQAFIALFVIVLARSNATYWVGRGAIAGWRRRRTAREEGRDTTTPQSVEPTESRARAEVLLTRFGPVAVTLSYLTVGIQTTIHLTAGLMRMPLAFYLPASVVGSVLWAALYATVGLAVVQACSAEAGSWLGVAALAVVAVAAMAFWFRSRRRKSLDVPDRAVPTAEGSPT